MMTPTLLVTAGPSREHFDDVRYLTNASSGIMGIEVAAAALRDEWKVHLALGPVLAEPPPGVHCHPFVDGEELDRIARELWPEVDALVAVAAVCDWRPRERISGKMKKTTGVWRPSLVRTADVLWNRAREKGERVLVGFALEAGPDLEEARRKLVQKDLDLIILNGTENLGSSTGNFEWMEKGGGRRSFRQAQKSLVAKNIVEFLRESLALRRTGHSG